MGFENPKIVLAGDPVTQDEGELDAGEGVEGVVAKQVLDPNTEDEVEPTTNVDTGLHGFRPISVAEGEDGPQAKVEQELLDAVSFECILTEGPDGWELRVQYSFVSPIPGNNEVITGYYTFTVQPPEGSQSGSTHFINAKGLTELFGITTKSELFADNHGSGTPLQWRFSLAYQDKKYGVAYALEDHWEMSHTHSDTYEEYELLGGTLAIAEKVDDDTVRFRTFTTTPEGTLSRTFLMNSKGEIVGGITEELHPKGSEPKIATHMGEWHNVWRPKGSANGTEKVAASGNPESLGAAGMTLDKDGGFLDNMLATIAPNAVAHILRQSSLTTAETPTDANASRQ